MRGVSGNVCCDWARQLSLTMTDELRREPVGVVGRELREELAFRSSELRLSEPSLKPLLMELLSSQLQRERGRDKERGERERGEERETREKENEREREGSRWKREHLV